jgi:hypothetical protein
VSIIEQFTTDKFATSLVDSLSHSTGCDRDFLRASVAKGRVHRGKTMNIKAPSVTDDDPDLRVLHAYWARQCGSRSMPRRADIHPKHIVSLLPEVFIADVCQPLRFRFRLVGSSICERWHEDFTGKWLDEMAFDGELENVIAQYSSVARTGTPRSDIEEFVNEESRYLHYRRLLLPLSDDGETATMLFGIQKAIGIDGYKATAPRLPKWM